MRFDPRVHEAQALLQRVFGALPSSRVRPSRGLGLFVDHPAASDRTTVIYSLVVSRQRHGHNPYDYLRDMLARLPVMTAADDLRPLLPGYWRPRTATTSQLSHLPGVMRLGAAPPSS